MHALFTHYYLCATCTDTDTEVHSTRKYLAVALRGFWSTTEAVEVLAALLVYTSCDIKGGL